MNILIFITKKIEILFYNMIHYYYLIFFDKMSDAENLGVLLQSLVTALSEAQARIAEQDDTIATLTDRVASLETLMVGFMAKVTERGVDGRAHAGGSSASAYDGESSASAYGGRSPIARSAPTMHFAAAVHDLRPSATVHFEDGGHETTYGGTRPKLPSPFSFGSFGGGAVGGHGTAGARGGSFYSEAPTAAVPHSSSSSSAAAVARRVPYPAVQLHSLFNSSASSAGHSSLTVRVVEKDGSDSKTSY